MEHHRRERHITLPPDHPDERRPLLSQSQDQDQTEVDSEDEPVYSCMTDAHSHLPVYTNIHRIRRDIVSVVEDHLSLEQLRDVRINLTVVRPLVDKFYELNDVSMIYCLLVNRAQFLDEQSHMSNRANVNWTRATMCELIAARILRRFNEDNPGPEGLLLLAHILVAGFEPFQNAPENVRKEARVAAGPFHRTLPSLEVAILTESKYLLSSTTCQRVVTAIYEGRIIYTPSTLWNIIPDHYKLKPISLYNPRDSPLLNQYRLTVPRTRNILDSMQFLILLGLYIGVMLLRQETQLSAVELMFAIYAFGWGLDQFATILAHGWNVYTQNLWSFLDVAFIGIYLVYLVLRIHGWRVGEIGPAEQAFDVLALAAPVIVPRLAFNLLSDNLVFLSLRSMMADFFLLTALAAWCFFGFVLSLLWLGEGAHPIVAILKWMIYIWFGLDGTGIERSSDFHKFFGPGVMVAFAFLGNTLFLTILVSMLSNTFSNISSNAGAEIQFRKAVLTLEGVKADAVFAYQPPFNILAVFVLLPLKFITSPRWFHKVHVACVRFLNLPLLLIIAAAERRMLWDSHRSNSLKTHTPMSKKWFWQRWHLTAQRDILTVFDFPVPDEMRQDVAVDDNITNHLIRRQFTRTNTAEMIKRKPARRDSMFPGIAQKFQSSLTDTSDDATVGGKVDGLEAKLGRMEAMLARLLPDDEQAVAEDDDNDEEDGMGESSTLRGDGFTVESSFRGESNNNV